jgi:anti-sigma regulatory factor (Ser/Thr protein kinase)
MTESRDWSHQTVLAAEPISALKARRFVCGHLVHHGLRYLMDAVRLVASELATNAISHARAPFTVTLARSDDTVTLTVQDGSRPIPVQRTASEVNLGGRGLAVVSLLSEDWGTSTDDAGRTSVWASFAARRTPEHSPAGVIRPS